MHPDLIKQFDTDIPLVNRFNAARTYSGPNHAENVRSRSSLSLRTTCRRRQSETVIAEQMAGSPRRIDRYARGSMLKTPFYQRAKNTEALPAARKAAEEVRDEKQAAVLRARQNQIANQP